MCQRIHLLKIVFRDLFIYISFSEYIWDVKNIEEFICLNYSNYVATGKCLVKYL